MRRLLSSGTDPGIKVRDGSGLLFGIADVECRWPQYGRIGRSEQDDKLVSKATLAADGLDTVGVVYPRAMKEEGPLVAFFSA